MRRLAAEAMEAGAFGMSSGLVYPPGLYCATEELVDVSRVVARHGGIYASHIRGEANPVVDSVREALRIGREADVPVEISHHKAAGRENWGKVRTTYALIAEAARTHDVTYDIYPYTAGSANLSQLVPPWAHAGGPETMLARLRDPELRPKIRHDVIHGTPDWNNFFVIDWRDIRLAYVHSERNRWMQGLSVHAAAEQLGPGPGRSCPGPHRRGREPDDHGELRHGRGGRGLPPAPTGVHHRLGRLVHQPGRSDRRKATRTRGRMERSLGSFGPLCARGSAPVRWRKRSTR